MGPYVRTLLALLLVTATPAVARAQVFFASEPHPKFAIGPLVIVATVRPDLGPINVSLLWSIVRLPGDRTVGEIRQDLYGARRVLCRRLRWRVRKARQD